MAAFSYKAMTRDGRRVDGTVQADDRRGALAAVRRLGHTPLSVSEVNRMLFSPLVLVKNAVFEIV